MIEYLGIMLLGIAAGVFTGLVPGIHPNTIVFSSIPLYFSIDIAFLNYICFISGLSVSHTFHDFLPAIILGIPEAETALSALPGAQMAADGRAMEAFMYTVAGGLFSAVAFILAVPILIIGLEVIYSTLSPFMAYILFFFLLFMIFKSNNVFYAAITAALSGFLGLSTFSAPVNQSFILLPVFSGLFAVPSIIMAFNEEIDVPEQHLDTAGIKGSFRGGFGGLLAGFMAGIFPGLGAATSTSLLAPLMNSRKEFLAGMGGVNTSDILMSFIALYTIGKARSGSSVALKMFESIDLPKTVFLIGVSLTSVAISASLSILVARFVLRRVSSLNVRKMSSAVTLIILAMTFWLTGFLGLLVLIVASLIGYSAALKNDRAVCISVLLVPAISFYSTGMFLYL